MIDKDFEKIASKIIYAHKNEFNLYLINKQRVHAIKSLKEYTGGSLIECMIVIDDYFKCELKSYIVQDRKQKLENLTKKTLVEEMTNKLIVLKKENLDNILMNLTVDELINLDKIIDKNTLNK